MVSDFDVSAADHGLWCQGKCSQLLFELHIAVAPEAHFTSRGRG